MSYKGEEIVRGLKRARLGAGLSQRALAERSGVTQSHISQIENGSTEPGLSSLIDLARALDMEVMLIPRKRTPAVSSLIDAQPVIPSQDPLFQKAMERAEAFVATTIKTRGSSATVDRLHDALTHLRYAPMSADDVEVATRALETFNRLERSADPGRRIREATDTLWSLRNRIAHGRAAPVRGAYSLMDEDEADG